MQPQRARGRHDPDHSWIGRGGRKRSRWEVSQVALFTFVPAPASSTPAHWNWSNCQITRGATAGIVYNCTYTLMHIITSCDVVGIVSANKACSYFVEEEAAAAAAANIHEGQGVRLNWVGASNELRSISVQVQWAGWVPPSFPPSRPVESPKLCE